MTTEVSSLVLMHGSCAAKVGCTLYHVPVVSPP
jgi:hypothetical protein